MTRMWTNGILRLSSSQWEFIWSLQKEMCGFERSFVESTHPKYTVPRFLFLLYPAICIVWFVPFHFHNGFLSSLMETYGDPFSLYRICPALMELRLDSGTYVCLDDSSFLVLFSSASYIIHRVKAVLLCRISHLLTWKSHGYQKAQHQSFPQHCWHHHHCTKPSPTGVTITGVQSM